MALIIASTPNFKLHPSFTSGLSPPHNNPNTTKLSFPSKPLIPISSLSNHITLNNFPNHICKYLQYPYPDPDPSRTHKHIRNIRAKTSTIPVSELESKTHNIWWSDVIVKYPTKNVFVRKLKEWNSLDILNLCHVVGMHVLALFAPFTFTWKAVWVGLGLGIITGWLGITLSYHRNLAHRSFKLPKWLEYTFAYCGVLASQGDPIGWVSTHRHHHQFCDTEKDPHTPRKGFWYSHINWVFDTKAFARLETPARKSCQSMETSNLEKSKSQDLPPSIDDLSSTSLLGLPKCGETNNIEDLEKQPFYRFIRSTYVVHRFLLGLLLYAFGGFPYLVWGMGVRTIVAYHTTFLVTSAAHVWGHQSWNTGDLSKNNWWIALLTSGEGWHNNHHAFPYSAKHGMEWWQIDSTWYAIKLLQILGLATDVKLPTEPHKTRLAFKYETTQANGIN